jgi:acyl dehydratase
MTHNANPELYFDDITSEDELPTKSIRLTVPIIIRWGAATEIFTRRDHFDLAYVQKHSDLKDIIGGGLWVNTYMLHYLKNWAGESGWVWRVNAQTRAHMFPGDVLTAQGKVMKTYKQNELGYVEVDAVIKQQDGVNVLPAKATIVLPLRGGKPVPYPFYP